MCRMGVVGCLVWVLMECQLPLYHSHSSNLQVTYRSDQKLPMHLDTFVYQRLCFHKRQVETPSLVLLTVKY